MGKRTLKGGALLGPLPAVMVSCGDMEKSNIITIAWTGILSTIPAKTYISVRPSRFSHDIIKQSGEFVINLTPASLIRAADYCGIYTGAKVDKFEKCALTKAPAEKLACPIIKESPINIECKVEKIVPLGSHDMFIANIVSVSVNDELFDKDGKIRFEKADLTAFAHGDYFKLGEKIGYFGFSAAKNQKARGSAPGPRRRKI